MAASKAEDSIGKKYGRLLVLSAESVLYPKSGRKVIRFKCLCDCGTVKEVISQDVRNGAVKSCGCLRNEKVSESAAKRSKYKIGDSVGKVFGRLTVIGEDKVMDGSRKRRKFLCSCVCGNSVQVCPHNLQTGQVVSCGCSKDGSAHRHTTEMFVEISKRTHRDKYDYSSTQFVDSDTKVEIVCKKHGAFLQDPSNHKSGNGCPSCCGGGFNSTEAGHIYVLSSGDIVKVGITNKMPAIRAAAVSSSSGRDFSVVWSMYGDGRLILQTETRILRELRKNFTPASDKFDGSTECFYDVSYNYVVKRIERILEELHGSY